MKKIFEISCLFVLCLALCGCPYSSAYFLDETPGINVDDRLLGKWLTYVHPPESPREEAVYLSLGKKTDTEYNISFSANFEQLLPVKLPDSDSLTGSAFMSMVGDRQFLNISIHARVYIAELTLIDDKLSLLPLAEHFTAKLVFNSQELRASVYVHYKTRVHPILDEEFCLRDMIRIN